MKVKMILSLIAALALMAPGAFADPEIIQVDATLGPGAAGIEDSISGPHEFGGFDVFDSVGFPGSGFTVDVFSGPSGAPGMDYELTMDWLNFATGDFAGGPATYSLSGIKPAGTDRPIGDVAVINGFGQPMPNTTINFNAGSISISGFADDLIAGGDIITIQWSQVPEPATLGLLAIGGLALLRRPAR